MTYLHNFTVSAVNQWSSDCSCAFADFAIEPSSWFMAEVLSFSGTCQWLYGENKEATLEMIQNDIKWLELHSINYPDLDAAKFVFVQFNGGNAPYVNGLFWPQEMSCHLWILICSRKYDTWLQGSFARWMRNRRICLLQVGAGRGTWFDFSMVIVLSLWQPRVNFAARTRTIIHLFGSSVSVVAVEEVGMMLTLGPLARNMTPRGGYWFNRGQRESFLG